MSSSPSTRGAIAISLRSMIPGDRDINSRYGKKYQRRKKKMVDKASLWLDQLFMDLIHQNHEDLPLDQPLGEDILLDLDPGMLKASGGGPAEDTTLGWSTRDEQLRSHHEDLKIGKGPMGIKELKTKDIRRGVWGPQLKIRQPFSTLSTATYLFY